MKESTWRTKLIAIMRMRNDNSFIWAHDAKFKAGFPDLTTIVNGTVCFYELKVSDRYKSTDTFDINVKRLFEPIQIATLKAITKAGGNASGLVLQSDGSVVDFDFQIMIGVVYSPDRFKYLLLN